MTIKERAEDHELFQDLMVIARKEERRAVVERIRKEAEYVSEHEGVCTNLSMIELDRILDAILKGKNYE